ncbi:XdhC family protein [Rhodococcus sp. NPDC059968]|uniref:XdhC family protein n=1 Tax=Rhodococcus sp. NPDC059968 TaxID=3347017 RepID=UPI00366B6A14
MKDIVDQLIDWHAQAMPCALSVVTRTWKSAPRPAGTAMAVSADGEVAGSLSGGCVEGAVYELAREALLSGTACIETFGVSDDDAFAAGLTCGGTLDVLVRPLREHDYPPLQELTQLRAAQRPAALIAPLNDPDETTNWQWRLATPDSLPANAFGEAVRSALMDGAARTVRNDGAREFDQTAGQPVGEVLIIPFPTRPRMIVFGATDFAAAVTRAGAFLGYRVTVCDARPVFVTRQRFPDADEIVVDWPHRYLESTRDRIDDRTAICVLTHDPKFDVPAVKAALRGPAGYVGVMGSRSAHQDRLERLRRAGLTDSELARLSSPIGLDLGARSPEETAISIAAEIVAARWGGSGTPLALTAVPIHRATGAPAVS